MDRKILNQSFNDSTNIEKSDKDECSIRLIDNLIDQNYQISDIYEQIFKIKVSGSEEFHYTMNDSIYGLESIHIEKCSPIPMDVKNFIDGNSYINYGFFTCINRVWFVIDNSLFFWKINDNCDVTYLDDSRNLILSLGIVKSSKNASYVPEEENWTIIVSTISEVLLINIFFNDSNYSQLYVKEIEKINNNGIFFNAISTTISNRIFLGSRNGELYELVEKSSSWFSKSKSYKLVNHSSILFDSILPNFIKNALTNKSEVEQISIDNSKNLLYLRKSDSSIEMFSFNEIDNNSTSYITSISYNNLIDEISILIGNTNKSAIGELITIESINSSESSIVSLIGMTKKGVRLYFTTLSIQFYNEINENLLKVYNRECCKIMPNGLCSAHGSSCTTDKSTSYKEKLFRHDCLRLVHVRWPHTNNHLYKNLYSKMINPSVEENTQQGSINFFNPYYNNGVFIGSINIENANNNNHLFSFSNDNREVRYSFRESLSQIIFSSDIPVISEINSFDPKFRKITTLSKVIDIYRHRKFVALNKETLVQFRLTSKIDCLEKIVIDNKGQESEKFRSYISNYGRISTSIDLFKLLNVNHSNNQVFNWFLNIFYDNTSGLFVDSTNGYVYTNNMSNGELVYISSNIVEFDRGLSYRMDGDPKKAINLHDEQIRSTSSLSHLTNLSVHIILLHVSKLLSPLWNKMLIYSKNDKEKIFFMEESTDVKAFVWHIKNISMSIEKFASLMTLKLSQLKSATNHNNNFNITTVINDVMKLNFLKEILDKVSEFLCFHEVVCYVGQNEFINSLTQDVKDLLQSLNFRGLLLKGNEIGKLFIMSLFNASIIKRKSILSNENQSSNSTNSTQNIDLLQSSRYSAAKIIEILLNSCPLTFDLKDANFLMVNEYLMLADNSTNIQEKDRFVEQAIIHFESILPTQNMFFVVRCLCHMGYYSSATDLIYKAFCNFNSTSLENLNGSATALVEVSNEQLITILYRCSFLLIQSLFDIILSSNNNESLVDDIHSHFKLCLSKLFKLENHHEFICCLYTWMIINNQTSLVFELVNLNNFKNFLVKAYQDYTYLDKFAHMLSNIYQIVAENENIQNNLTINKQPNLIVGYDLNILKLNSLEVLVKVCEFTADVYGYLNYSIELCSYDFMSLSKSSQKFKIITLNQRLEILSKCLVYFQSNVEQLSVDFDSHSKDNDSQNRYEYYSSVIKDKFQLGCLQVKIKEVIQNQKHNFYDDKHNEIIRLFDYRLYSLGELYDFFGESCSMPICKLLIIKYRGLHNIETQIVEEIWSEYFVQEFEHLTPQQSKNDTKYENNQDIVVSRLISQIRSFYDEKQFSFSETMIDFFINLGENFNLSVIDCLKILLDSGLFVDNIIKYLESNIYKIELQHLYSSIIYIWQHLERNTNQFLVKRKLLTNLLLKCKEQMLADTDYNYSEFIQIIGDYISLLN